MRPRVFTASLGEWVDPAHAFAALCRNSDAAFWLDCGPNAHTGTSYLGIGSTLTTEFNGSVFDWLRAQQFDGDAPGDFAENATGFALGWVGWLGYELRGETMGLAVSRRSRYPDAGWMFVDRCLAFDHESREVTLLALDDLDGYQRTVREALTNYKTVGGSRVPPQTKRSESATWAYTDADYLTKVIACQEAIREGDAYQLCLTTEARVDVTPDAFETYVTLRSASPTHHGALVIARGVSILCASPERFLRVSRDGEVETKPIKGTRGRGDTAVSDARARFELESSDKERAENLMIVDLMRNDLARVCELGSVSVTSLLEVETYAQVHQLVSTVRGQLADGLSSLDAVEACFPAGSMTGAPKHSATQILDGLEQRARGIYSGAIGYLGLDGAIDLAMVIRSIVIDRDGSTVGAGGGITALSVPEDELAEAKLKAEVLLRVLGVDAA